MKTFLFAFFIFLGFSAGFSQNRFTKAYSIWSEMCAHNMEQTSDNGFIICADAVPEMDTINNIAWGHLIKTNWLGQTEWVKRYEKSNYFQKPYDGNAVTQTNDGGYIMGSTWYQNTPASYQAIYVIKTDNLGNPVWSNHYPGVGISICFSIKQTADSGYIIAGLTADTITGIQYCYLLKIGSTGTPQWGKCFSDSFYYGSFYSAEQTSDGGFLCCGYVGLKTVIMKTDANGNSQWCRIMSLKGNLWDIHQTPDGGCISSGYAVLGQNYYPLLLKLDAAASIQWTKIYCNSASSYDYGYTCTVETNGYALTVTNGMEPALIHTDLSGNVDWEVEYNGLYSYRPASIDRTNDNGYILTPGSTVNWDIVLLKTDSSGRAFCNDTALAISDSLITVAFDSVWNVLNSFPVVSWNTVMQTYIPVEFLICGDSIQTEGISDHGIPPANLNVFPNPATENLTVEISALHNDDLVIQLVNVYGQVVLERKAKGISGVYQEELNLEGLANGVYFVSVRVDGHAPLVQKILRD
jgi:hypothetical protein